MTRRSSYTPFWPQLALWACLAGGCLDVADERARIDEGVGTRTVEGARIEVADGAAAVRALDAEAVRLFGTTPTWEATLRVDNAGAFEIRLDNVMADATLEASAMGQPLALTLRTRPTPTERIFDATLPADTEVTLRVVVPDADDTTPFRFAVFADVQEAIDDVQDIYRRMNADPTIRFVVMSGDLTERGENDQLRRFQQELTQLDVPCFSTLGNHELGAAEGNYHRFFGRGSRHFTFHGAHFTLIDDASATIAPQVYEWLDGWLDDGAGAFHSVYMHLPPLDVDGARNGAFASRPEANRLLGKLARAGVDVTIYGHVHTYDAYTNAGIPAFVTGGGGAIPERLDHIGRHFLTVDVDPEAQLFQTAIVHVD